MKLSEFKDAIQEMLWKEQDHLVFLKESYSALNHNSDILQMIIECEMSIEHLKERISDYNEYMYNHPEA